MQDEAMGSHVAIQDLVLLPTPSGGFARASIAVVLTFPVQKTAIHGTTIAPPSMQLSSGRRPIGPSIEAPQPPGSLQFTVVMSRIEVGVLEDWKSSREDFAMIRINRLFNRSFILVVAVLLSLPGTTFATSP